MRLMPSRYVGDMCSRPSTSLPLLMRWSVVASLFSSTAISQGLSVASHTLLRLGAHALEVAAAAGATILAEQQLRAKERDELCARGAAERAVRRGSRRGGGRGLRHHHT